MSKRSPDFFRASLVLERFLLSKTVRADKVTVFWKKDRSSSRIDRLTGGRNIDEVSEEVMFIAKYRMVENVRLTWLHAMDKR